MTLASRRPFAWRRTAFASMDMSRWAYAWRKKFAGACISPTKTPGRSPRLVANHMRFADAERMKESTLKRFLRLPKFDEHLALHRMDCLSSHGDLTLYNFVRDALATDAGRGDQARAVADRTGPDRSGVRAWPAVPRNSLSHRRCAVGREAQEQGRGAGVCGAGVSAPGLRKKQVPPLGRHGALGRDESEGGTMLRG